jgi:cation transport protein ChaC
MTAANPWPKLPFPHLDEDERARLFRETMAQAPNSDDVWVFGFGSLLWNPGFAPLERRPATLDGYQRRFQIWSTMARGTPDRPGLALCLEPTAGNCRGIAYRLAPESRESDLAYLWQREMVSGVYRAAWIDVVADDGSRVTALTWLANPGHIQSAGPRPAEEMAKVMAGGKGKYGTCRDYPANTIVEMAKLGERDPFLERVLELIDAGVIPGARP